MAYRELDESLGLTSMGDDIVTDSRLGTNKQHLLVPLLHRSIYSRLAGYEDVNDAERLVVDPAMRYVVGGRASQPEKQAALASEVGRFECICYHPLFLFNQFGDPEHAMLHRGNKASVKFWLQVLLPVIERYRHLDFPKFFRVDAAFSLPKLIRPLEDECYLYAIHIKANAVLEREIEHLLTRPVHRPSHKPKVFCHTFRYQAKSWRSERRVVAKFEWHASELFPRVGFIVTNLARHSKYMVKFYNGR